MYHWGYNEKTLERASVGNFDDDAYKSLAIPIQMSKLRYKYITDIKCSVTHSLALTDSGEVNIV